MKENFKVYYFIYDVPKYFRSSNTKNDQNEIILTN